MIFSLIIIPSHHPPYHRHLRFDRSICLIPFEDDMMEIKIIDRGETWIYANLWKWMWSTTHLLLHLLDMILIDMDITEGMDQSSCLDTEKMSEDMDEK